MQPRRCLLLLALVTAASDLADSVGIRASGRRLGMCDIPALANGKALRRQRGRVIEFICNRPYRLIGSKFSTCKHMRWDSPLLICVRPGCPDIKSEKSSFIIAYEDNRASAKIFCLQGLRLRGSPVTYCDGKNWDRNLGICREYNTTIATSCDFETADLCGWEHDANDDFEWKRHNGIPMLLRQRTGPRSDHTTGRVYEGYYMTVQSFEQEAGEVARLISPVYSRNLSQDACFRFYYHMYGTFVGSLRVYVRPISVGIDDLSSSPNYKYFDKSGNQKNLWREGFFNIEAVDEDFQIVFESTLASSLNGDMAIDDVSLLQGSDCLTEDDLPGTTTEEVEGVAGIQSCKNRCNETEAQTTESEVLIKSGKVRNGLLELCDCFEGCIDSNSCCPDYNRECVFNDVQNETVNTMATTSKTVISTTPVAFKATTSAISTIIKSTTQKKSEKFVKLVTEAVTESTVHLIVTPAAIDNHGMEDISTHKTIIFAVVAVVVGAAVISTMFLIRHIQRKKFNPEFYKNRTNHAKSSHSANEEFSEVRYLTEEEHLDFTIATPRFENPEEPPKSPKEKPKSTSKQKSGKNRNSKISCEIENERLLDKDEWDNSGNL